MFQDVVEDPETMQQNIDVAQEEIERLQKEREEQRHKTTEQVAAHIGAWLVVVLM